MDIPEKELLIRVGLVLISFYPALVGFGAIKVMSRVSVSLCYAYVGLIILSSALASLNDLTIILIIISLAIFICDRAHLINFKTFVFVDFDGSSESFENAVKNEERLNKYLTVNGSRVTFHNPEKKIIKENLKLLLKIKKENKNKIRLWNRIGVLLVLNFYLIFTIFRLFCLLR